MKFGNSDSDVTIVGDIKSNSVSIDQENIGFIVTILSTNLYSNPIESFVRETVSNAWDSHVEAKIDDPVILELGKDTEGKYFCAIRDFGVGLSQDRFNKIYRNIGSSTKRGDNDQIGGFGIGRFSALAYSEVVYITTNYDGVKYVYMMYKDGNSVSIDLLYESPTTERNGLEVKVPIKSYYDLKPFCNAIHKQLVYFDNLYLIDTTEHYTITDEIRRFNELNIKRYDNFYVNNLSFGQIDLILGKVRYPLRFGAALKTYKSTYQNYPISLKFEVGDLEVTPNREEILYNKKNITKIEEKLDAALEEIQILIEAYFIKDFTNIPDYIKAIQDEDIFPILQVDDKKTVYLKIEKSHRSFTLNGKSYDDETFKFCYSALMQKSIKMDYTISGKKLRQYHSPESIDILLHNKYTVYISNIPTLKPITKDYLRDKYEDALFVGTKITVYGYYRKILKELYDDYEYSTTARHTYYGNQSKYYYDLGIYKILFKYVLKSFSTWKIISNKSVPLQYALDRKAAMLANRSQSTRRKLSHTEITLDELRKSNRGYSSVVSESEVYFIDKLNTKTKRLNIYAERDNDKIRDLYRIFRNESKVVRFYEVAPTKIKNLEGVTSFVNIKNFLNVEYKLIRKIATAYHIIEQFPKLKELASISNLDEISKKLENTVHTLSNYCDKYSQASSTSEKALVNEILQLCQDKNYFDEEMKAIFNENKKMLNNAIFLIGLKDTNYTYSNKIPKSRINLAIDYILARRLFRPDIEAVKKAKEDEVLYNQQVMEISEEDVSEEVLEVESEETQEVTEELEETEEAEIFLNP